MRLLKYFLVAATVAVTAGFGIASAEILPSTGGTTIQNLDFKSIIPEPIKNLTNKASGLQMNLNDFPKLKSAVESVRGVVGDPADIVKDPGSWWARMNDWLHAKVGFDFRQLAKAIGGLFLWVLDIVKELVTWVISKI